MSSNIANYNDICLRYAKALASSCQSENDLKKNKESFDSLISLINDNEDFKKFVFNPLITSHQKLRILNKILIRLNLNNNFSNFLKVITKHNRLFTVKKIYHLFTTLIEEKNNITKIEVTTSKPINNNLSKSIKLKFEKITKKNVNINNLVDADILGGVIIKFNSIMIDASVKTKLEKYQLSTKG